MLAHANSFNSRHYITAGVTADLDSAGYFNKASDMVRSSDMVLVNVNTDGTPASGIYLASSNVSSVVDVADMTAVGSVNTD